MATTLISAAEFELLADAPGKQELLEGELILLSPAKLAHSEKTTSYLRFGAEEVWIVYPGTRHMLVHRIGGIEKITDIYENPSFPVFVRMSEVLSQHE